MLTTKIDKMIQEIESTLKELREIQDLNEVLNDLDKRAMEKIAQYME